MKINTPEILYCENFLFSFSFSSPQARGTSRISGFSETKREFATTLLQQLFPLSACYNNVLCYFSCLFTISPPPPPPPHAPATGITVTSTGLEGRPVVEEVRRLLFMEFVYPFFCAVFIGATIGGLVGQDFLTPVGRALVTWLLVYVGTALVRVWLAKYCRLGL